MSPDKQYESNWWFALLGKAGKQFKTIWFIFFLSLSGLILFALTLRGEDSNPRNIIKELQLLNANNVSSIMVCDHLIDNPASISSIINTFHSGKISRSQKNFSPTGLPLFSTPLYSVVNLKDGRNLHFTISRCLAQPSNASIDVSATRPFYSQSHLFIENLSAAFEKIGLHLPEKSYFDGAGIFEPIKSSSLIEKPRAMSLTLFNIERSSSLNGPSFLIMPILLSGFFISLVLVLLYLGFVDKNLRQDRKSFMMTCAALALLFSFFAYIFGREAFDFNLQWHRYHILRTALQKGECKILTGTLTDADFHKEGHWPLDLTMIEVQGHQFYFPSNRTTIPTFSFPSSIEGSFFDSHGWVNWAAEQLSPNILVRVWYARIDGWDHPSEHVARIDVY